VGESSAKPRYRFWLKNKLQPVAEPPEELISNFLTLHVFDLDEKYSYVHNLCSSETESQPSIEKKYPRKPGRACNGFGGIQQAKIVTDS
jgi:hypothetical protein